MEFSLNANEFDNSAIVFGYDGNKFRNGKPQFSKIEI